MSIALQTSKYRPGMRTSLDSGTSGGITTQAVQHLTSTAAKGTVSFKLNGLGKTNYVKGVRGNVNLARPDYTRARAKYNTTLSSRYSTLGATTSGTTSTVVSYNSSNNLLTTLSLITTGIKSIGNLFGAFTSSSQALDNIIDNGTGGSLDLSACSSEIASSIRTMTSATTSSALRNAISAAEKSKAEISAKLPEAASKAKEANENYSKLKSQVDEKKDGVDKLESAIKKDENSIASIEKKLNGLDTDYANASENLTKAETRENKAKAAVDTAQGKYDTAKTDLESAEKELENAESLPADTPNRDAIIARAKAAVEQKKAALEQAETELEKAKNELTEATEAKDEAASEKERIANEKEEVNDDFKNQREQLNKTKEKLEEDKKAYEEAKGELEPKKEELESAENAQKEYQQLATDENALENTIKEQKSRLEKLEKEEEKEYNNLGKTVTKKESDSQKKWQKIDSTDGISNGELKKINKITDNNSTISDATKKRETLRQELVLKELAYNTTNLEQIGNDTYNKVFYEGKTYYSKNGVLISEAEYQERV